MDKAKYYRTYHVGYYIKYHVDKTIMHDQMDVLSYS